MELYRKREKKDILDYDIFIGNTDYRNTSSDLERTSLIMKTYEFINNLKKDYDVIFCSPRVNIPSFDDYFLLPRLKDKGSSGYDVSIQGITVLDRVKRVELGVKYYMPDYLSIEGKLRSGTFKKSEVLLTNKVMELDATFRGNCQAELMPIMYFLNKGQNNNDVPILHQFMSDDLYTRIDYIQFKFIPVHTHIVHPPVDFDTRNLRIAGIVCQNVWNDFVNLFPSDRGEGGFHSTDSNKKEQKSAFDVLMEDPKSKILFNKEYQELVDEEMSISEQDVTTDSYVDYQKGEAQITNNIEPNLDVTVVYEDSCIYEDSNQKPKDRQERFIDFELENNYSKFTFIDLNEYEEVIVKVDSVNELALELVNSFIKRWENYELENDLIQNLESSIPDLPILIRSVNNTTSVLRDGKQDCKHSFVNKPKTTELYEINKEYHLRCEKICNSCGRYESGFLKIDLLDYFLDRTF